MVTIRPKQIKLIKTLQRAVGLDDDGYREMLWGIARVKSCKDLTGPKVDLVIRHLERCLGKRGKGERAGGAGAPACGPSRATETQLAMIRGLWGRVSRVAQEWGAESRQARQALNKFLWSRFKAAAPEWLTLPQAQRVIEALKSMGQRGKACGNG